MVKRVIVPYCEEELAFIKANCKMPRRELTEVFNREFGRQVKVEHIKELCKRKGWATGRTGCFEKGHVPWSKGTKGVLKGNAGCFKKGNRPHNKAAIGDEVMDKGWVRVKVAEPNVWRNKSHLVWEQSGREPLKKGQFLVHIDGDFTNNEIENLMMVTRADLLKINRKKFRELPSEVVPSLVLAARLDTKWRNLRKSK